LLTVLRFTLIMHAESIVIALLTSFLRLKNENEIAVNNNKNQKRHQFVGGLIFFVF